MATNSEYQCISQCIGYVKHKHNYDITPLCIWAKSDKIHSIVDDGVVKFNICDVIKQFNPDVTNRMTLKDTIENKVKRKYKYLWGADYFGTYEDDDYISIVEFIEKDGFDGKLSAKNKELMDIDVYYFAKTYDKDDKQYIDDIIRDVTRYEMNRLSEK